MRTRSSPLKSGVGRNIALHASSTHQGFLSHPYFHLPGSFTFSFIHFPLQILCLRFNWQILVLDSRNKIGRPAHSHKRFEPVPCTYEGYPALSIAFHHATVLGDSDGVVNSLDVCPASLKSLGCFYFRCVLSSQWKAVTVNLRILHCQH